MVAFDADVLTTDPGQIAVGGGQPTTRGEPTARDETATAPTTTSLACQAALAGYRTALMFRVLFTGLVFVVSVAAAAALVYALFKAVADGVDLSVAVTGIGGLLASGAAIFLGKRMQEAINVARQALEDVGTYCGTTVRQQLT